MNSVKLDYSAKKKLTQTESPWVEMCFLNNEYKGLHVPVFCKDYLNEVIATELDGKSRTVYGFTSEETNEILNNPTFKLALVHIKEAFPEEYITALENFMPQLDVNRGFIPTEIERTNDPKIIVIHGDIRWLLKPVYLSFYTLMLRVSMGYNNESVEDYLTDYVKRESKTMCNPEEKYTINGIIPFLIYLANGGEIEQRYEDYPLQEGAQYNLHNNSGVKSYFNQILKNIVPNVTKEKEEVNSI